MDGVSTDHVIVACLRAIGNEVGRNRFDLIWMLNRAKD
jgi:hypothetical protein